MQSMDVKIVRPNQHFKILSFFRLTDLRLRFHSIRRLVEMYTIKIAAALGYDPTLDTNSIASVDTLQGVSVATVTIFFRTKIMLQQFDDIVDELGKNN